MEPYIGPFMKPKETILTEKHLQSLCAFYQWVLKLQDWLVKVQVVRAQDLDRDDVDGQAHYTLTRKEALIWIRDPTDYDPASAFPQDMETDLVHELLHLHFAGVTDTCAESEVDIQTPLEQGIESLAKAIVGLRRKTQAYIPDYYVTGQVPKEEE